MFTDDLITGDETIDLQHRELITISRWLVHNGHEVSAFASGFAFLEEYIIDHFSSEAMAMHQSGYPKLRSHLMAHEYFMEHVGEVATSLRRDGPTPALRLELQVLVQDLFVQHIRTHDILLARWLRENSFSVQPSTTESDSWWARFRRMTG